MSEVVDEQLLNKVSDMLKERHLTVATAESCTGGLLAHLLTNVSGSSAYFDQGVVSYSNHAKQDLLGVPAKTLASFGAVSEPTARAMAEGVRARAGVDIGIATTGIAGPTGGTPDKPVGLVFIAVSSQRGTVVSQFQFHGTRQENKQESCKAALTMLAKVLSYR